MGSVWDGGEKAGREGDGEGGGGYGGVGLCVCVSRSMFVCMHLCQVRVGWQGEELELQEVYRWAKDRAAKKGQISDIRNTDMGVF